MAVRRDDPRQHRLWPRRTPAKSQIVAAAQAAHVDHFVRTLPDGYDTVIDDDATNLSPGEKQLPTIARAFLADPRVLILDEATSSVDTRTEVLVQRAMARLMRGRTTFVIAHRLSTIRDADTILVMDAGRIVEQGSHEELRGRRVLRGPLPEPVRGAARRGRLRQHQLAQPGEPLDRGARPTTQPPRLERVVSLGSFGSTSRARRVGPGPGGHVRWARQRAAGSGGLDGHRERLGRRRRHAADPGSLDLADPHGLGRARSRSFLECFVIRTRFGPALGGRYRCQYGRTRRVVVHGRSNRDAAVRREDPTSPRRSSRRPPQAAGPPGMSTSRIGRCSWSERVAASAIRRAATPSAAVHGLGASPRAMATKATNSAR